MLPQNKMTKFEREKRKNQSSNLANKAAHGNLPQPKNFYSFVPRNKKRIETHLMAHCFFVTRNRNLAREWFWNRETRSKKKLLVVPGQEFPGTKIRNKLG